MKKPSHSLFWLLLGATTIGCSGSPGRGQDAGLRSEVRDSAGVRIVDNASPAGIVWREIDPTPLVEIAPVTGEGELLRIVGAHRLSDGSLVVASAGTSTIAVFNGDGTRRATFGGKGGGPGEFEGMAALLPLPADSFGVRDAQRARLSIFTTTGLAREVSFAGEAGGGGRRTVLAHAGDNTWLVRPGGLSFGGNSIPQSGVIRDTTRFALLQGPPGPLDTLTTLPAGESFLSVGVEGSQIRTVEIMSLPVRRMAEAVVSDSLIWAMSSDQWEIEGRRRDGSLAGLIRLDEPTKAFPPELYAAMKAVRLERTDPGPQRDRISTAWDGWPVPELTPVMQGLKRASDGTLWVERYTALDTMPRVHVVFDGVGKVLGEVWMPPRFRTMDIGSDWILGVWQDEDDLEWVRMYRLGAGNRE